MVALTPIITRSIDAARGAGDGFHAEHVVRRGPLQQTVLALLEGTVLTEHESDVPASVYILHGAIRVEGPEPYVIEQGALHELKEHRRAVVALQDTVMLLSASTSESGRGIEAEDVREYVLAPE